MENERIIPAEWDGCAIRCPRKGSVNIGMAIQREVPGSILHISGGGEIYFRNIQSEAIFSAGIERFLAKDGAPKLEISFYNNPPPIQEQLSSALHNMAESIRARVIRTLVTRI